MAPTLISRCVAIGCLLILPSALFHSASGEGSTYDICGNYVRNANSELWGYLQSDGYPGGYGYNRNCYFELNVNVKAHEYIAFRVLEWSFDESSYSDRFNVLVKSGGSWSSVVDLYAWSDYTWLDNFKSNGHIKIRWYTDGYKAGHYTGTQRWKITWTYQRMNFGCELSPQPYIFTNTTRSGIVQSPFFPDHYPVNAYCHTVIDVMQETDAVEFVSMMFKFRSGDYVRFYVGDAYLDNWVEYEAFSSSNSPPESFTIYGADIKILFTSDHLACAMGYYMYWRVISSERYPIHKPETLIGFWPMTAAHRGNDIIQGCNAVNYPPTTGTISPATGPTGGSATSLYLEGSFLEMTSATCLTSTRLNNSYTISIFAETKVMAPLVEFYDSGGGQDHHFWSHHPSAGQFYNNPAEGSPTITGSCDLPKWQYLTVTRNPDIGKQVLYSDAVVKASVSTTNPPNPTYGFDMGHRPGGFTQTGRFTCLNMYTEALSQADLAKTRTMCQKFHDQYEIYSGSSLVAWYPMTSMDNSLTRDFSGNGCHGTVSSTSAVTMTSGPSGAANGAYYFDGSGSAYSNVPYCGAMNGFRSFTVSAFVKTTTIVHRPILESRHSGGQRAFDMWIWPNGTWLHMNMDVSGGGPYQSVDIGGAPTWKFVSSSYDLRLGLYKLHVDGVEVGSWSLSNHYSLFHTTGVTIGGEGSLTGYTWLGEISCLSIYKTALKPAQLLKIREACLTDIENPPSLVELIGFWPMTELTGLLDISGNELHGTRQSTNVTLTTGPFGRPNSAYQLGADPMSYITFSHAGLDLTTRSYTISCYVQSSLSNVNGPVVEYVTSAANDPGIHLWVQNGDIIFNDNNGVRPVIAAWDTVTWHFLSVVFDSELSTLSVYRDGAKLGSWGSSSSAASSFGMIVGARLHAAGTAQLVANVSCLSIYNTALDADGIGRVMKMCNSYIMDSAMRDQSRSLETNCNFDNGFCGWYQDTTDDGDWQLWHDATPTGGRYVFSTGPRLGISQERAQDLDQYALLNANAIGWYRNARMISPVVASGTHCFEFWYYMAGSNANQFRVYLLNSNKQFISAVGYKGKQWHFLAKTFEITSPDQIVIDGTAGSTRYSDIAIDNIRVTEGPCGGTNPCPRGWTDFGKKCYMPFVNGRTFSRGQADTTCTTRLKSRIAVPEDAAELDFLKSLAGGTQTHIGLTKSGSVWVDELGYEVTYLPWESGHPAANSYSAITSSGLIGVGSFNGGFICEVTKLEAQHLGFNCSFDNKHLCGWWNIYGDSNENANGNPSADVDIWGGFSMAYDYSAEDGQNGPERDFNIGNTRGYYAMLEDNAVQSCSSMYMDLYSPVMLRTGKPQCLRFRSYRSKDVRIEVYPWFLRNDGSAFWGPALTMTGYHGHHWRTLQLEYNPDHDYMFIIRMWYSCYGEANNVIDDIQLFDSTCSFNLFQWQQTATSISTYNYIQANRPSFPNWDQAQDTLNDFSFATCGNSGYWRNMPGDNGKFECNSWTRVPGWRRTGPQSDYTGEDTYMHDNLGGTTSGSTSLQHKSMFSGPPIPRGQRCFIFHYFFFGYDVGEMRIRDGHNRYLWSIQGSQYPAWHEHRILFSNYTATNVIFEVSSGFNDGNTHWARYDTMQIDDLYTRNGTDLCYGYMDCNFDLSSYLTSCGWLQNDTDDGDWVRNHGETPAGNSYTGPGSDQTTGDGHYLYVDATGLNPGAKTRIHMPTIQAGTSCLTFQYHMWGADMGSLRIFYVPRDNLAYSNGNFPPYSETTLWEQSGNQGNRWIRAMVPLELPYPQVITFEAVRGTGDRSDIAIDDVVLLQGPCPNDRSYSCSFERGDLCVWYQDTTDNTDFVVNRGKTTGAPMSGPEGDSTGVYAGGYYLYLPGASTSSGDTARILSPWIPAGTICFQMAYNMRGRQVGKLAIYRNSDLIVSVRAGTTDYDWQHITLTIPSSERFVLKIEAIRGPSSLADIAIDDITITEGQCPGDSVVEPPGNVIEFTTTTSYFLNNHNMTEDPLEVTYARCVITCQTTPGCMSINYNSGNSSCTLNDATYELDPYNFLTATADDTYLTLSSPFAQTDSFKRNLCTLDSQICTVTTNCSTSGVTSMLVCQCQQPGRSCFMPQDCDDLFDNDFYADGAYLIQPGASGTAVTAKCDMDVGASRGHTILAERSNGGLRFHDRKLPDYANFFGSASREYWIGLEAMTQLTNLFTYGYTISGSLLGTAYTSIQSVSTSTPFHVASANDNYRVTLEQLGAMPTNMFNKSFSAQDADQTGSTTCVANSADAGWWYNPAAPCTEGILTAPYRPSQSGLSTSKDGMYVSTFGSGIGLSNMRLSIMRV